MSNSLSVEQLRSQLTALGVENRGHRNELRSRLKKRQQQQQQQRQHGQGRGGPTTSSMADSATSWRRTGPSEERGKQRPASEWEPKVDSYLVLDVEATCERGKVGQPRRASFEFPNEIIEFPLVLLQWRRREDGRKELYTKDIFHTYVRPVWRPRLTQFCRSLTGISQDDIDCAPSFAEAVDRLHAFLASHLLLEAGPARQILSRRAKATPSPFLKRGVCWVTHGPFDLLHFVVKQSFISGLAEGVPSFLRGPLIDIKLSAVEVTRPGRRVKTGEGAKAEGCADAYPFRDTTVDGLLAMLGLEPFEGRHHCGLDDTKNIARIFVNIADRVASIAAGSPVEGEQGEARTLRVEEAAGVEKLTLFANTPTDKGHLRRWDWMCSRQPGKVIWEEPEEL